MANAAHFFSPAADQERESKPTTPTPKPSFPAPFAAPPPPLLGVHRPSLAPPAPHCTLPHHAAIRHVPPARTRRPYLILSARGGARARAAVALHSPIAWRPCVRWLLRPLTSTFTSRLCLSAVIPARTEGGGECVMMEARVGRAAVATGTAYASCAHAVVFCPSSGGLCPCGFVCAYAALLHP